MSEIEVEIEDLLESSVRHRVHLDGPRGKKGWFGDIHVCVEHPRLRRFTKYMRADRSAQVTWEVDGVDVGLLENAVAALNKPPVLTPEETAALAFLTDDWQDLRGRPGPPEFMVLMRLDVKGVVEFEAGKCRMRRAAVFVPAPKDTGD